MRDYDEFLDGKASVVESCGFEPSDVNQLLYPFQTDIVRWACRKVERGIDLWSKPDDLVLSPFAGIGSEGYVAVSKGRRFVGIELKPSYWNLAAKNLKAAEDLANQMTLFDFMRVDNCP